MFTEKHILGNPYNNHKLSRTVTGYEVTTVDCSADKTSGYSGTTVNLTPTQTGSTFTNWSITGATLTGNAFNFDNSDVTVVAYYAPPIPNGAIRVKTSDGAVPTKYSYTKYTRCEKVDGYEDVYDVFQESGTGYVWYETLRSSPNVIEVLGSNATNVSSCYQPFYDNSQITAINNFELCTGVNNGICCLCRGLTDVSILHSERASSTYEWFSNCESLRTAPELDLSNVVRLNSMFFRCYSLSSLPLYNLSNVTSIYQSFSHCSSLSALPLFDTHNVVDARNAFILCTKISAVPLFDTTKIKNVDQMFQSALSVQGGASALYQQLSTKAISVTSHISAFYKCGYDTTQGRAELNQIPTGWGGYKY